MGIFPYACVFHIATCDIRFDYSGGRLLAGVGAYLLMRSIGYLFNYLV